MSLCLFDSDAKPVKEIPMNRTGEVFHIELVNLPGAAVLYGVRVSGDGGWERGCRWDDSRVLLDPYAPLVQGRRLFGIRDSVENFRGKSGSRFLGTFDFSSEPFDWGPAEPARSKDGSKMARIHSDPTSGIVYEVSVRCFTADSSSGLPEEIRGTYKGLAAKAEYLKSLGVTVVELLPVCEWDELEFQRTPNPRQHMTNVWGYSPINYFAPMSRFAASGGGAAAASREFKEMVKTLHAAGIEVILDVVYNHTVEGDDDDPYTLSFRGIDNGTYYMVDERGAMRNHSGCGNTFSANHPIGKKLVLDSLVHWVSEYHVDGFRFDLASCLCRDPRGEPLAVPPVIKEIAQHPLLKQVRLIAEPWDLGLYQVGSFPNWDTWGEWNGIYRDDVRKFIKGDAGMKKALATRIAGSADLYNNHQRKPYHGVNFIVAHDGFSLADLVSYNGKHNDANGEGNRDGTNDNFSWNCGAEGDTDDGGVTGLRNRQIRNLNLALMVSQGTPMMVMGDEIGSTHYGNNNWYGHDTKLSHMNWQQGGKGFDKDALFRFTSKLIHFRKSHPVFRKQNFIGPSDITWHEDNWDNTESRFLAFTLHDKTGETGDIYVAFNSHSFPVTVGLPQAPHGKKWHRIVDTNLPSPQDFTDGNGYGGLGASYTMVGFSSLMLLAK